MRTDHQSLQHLWTQRISTLAQQKWLHKLMGFDFFVEYKKGKENLVADALSRMFEDNKELHVISSPVPNWLKTIKDEICSNPRLIEIRNRIEADEAIGPWKFIDGVILFKDRLYLANESPLTDVIIKEIHDSTHEGYLKTFQRME
ncbi:hypothetical protein Scep_023813 [Stephania cephalantha]|uniref:Reverse transcriptase RNase H-like domain-containing protein n=1 Tax=Stephania cephalantha TaxID=152367 RepID=A0AAP0F0U4_9MAGN